jgi:hypothetical protein
MSGLIYASPNALKEVDTVNMSDGVNIQYNSGVYAWTDEIAGTATAVPSPTIYYDTIKASTIKSSYGVIAAKNNYNKEIKVQLGDIFSCQAIGAGDVVIGVVDLETMTMALARK